MRTPLILAVVIGAHCLAIGSLLLISQGCETISGPRGPRRITGSQPQIERAPRAEYVEAPSVPVEPSPPRYIPVPRRVEVKPVVSGPTTEYVVGRGDSLSVIAKKYDVSVMDIMKLNGIHNKNRIREGQTLLLPGKVNVDSPKQITRTSITSPVLSAEGDVYVIKSGDTLSHIGKKFGVKVDDIQTANNINGHMIRVGQKIIIPSGSGTAETSRSEMDSLERALGIETSDEEMSNSGPALPNYTAPKAEKENVLWAEDAIDLEEYEVQESDDMRSISMLWSVSAKEIRRVNGMSANQKVKPKQILKIPIMSE